MVTVEAPNRRASDRFRLHPMYTRVVVSPAARAAGGAAGLANASPLEGHAYNISITGVRFELDEELPIGTAVDIELFLPGEPRTVRASGRVVRLFDSDDDPGPRRMAVHFSDFASAADRARLERQIEDRWFGMPE